ncbi:hypothetical protein [Novosphingobium album (ex Hu et al. 2023)]|uniref:Uncharacterized protein n=1 Tax=Novosphingobium album (ex Hu et al. 2023) TaxID=2930093 RepID=A0ABT0B555_9SPHN|nr:hypothetical protein [Novosphingobium album (ex Hu et al. 2023)]MCJ2180016.1 hypothetical protein [Novosphingobium album (ex Hu et al. 2023)]
MLDAFLVFAAIYLAGWFATACYFSGIQGPVPVPGRLRRDVRDGLFWPVWLLLFALIWLIGLRRQAFEKELPEE